MDKVRFYKFSSLYTSLYCDSATDLDRSLFWQAVLSVILDHVSELGWENSTWTDDNLSSKKLYPKFQFPARSKKWYARMKTSETSMALAVEFLQTRFLAKQKHFRQKPDVNQVEETSLKAAVAVNLLEEFLNMVPVDPVKAQKEWLEAWSSGDSKIDIELDGLILEKSDSLDLRQIPTFKRLSDEHCFTKPMAKTQHQEASLQWDEYNLLVKQIEYDEQVFKTYEKKIAAVQASRDHASFKWKVDRRNQCLEAAELFMESCCRILSWDKKAEKNIAEAMNFKRQVIMAKLGLDHVGQIPQVVFLNSTAPCLHSSTTQTNAVELLTWALADNMQSVAMVLQPVFTYQKGRLVLEERSLLDALCRGNHNVDWTFAALFNEKCDSRDLRPMCYNGRFVYPSPLDLAKNCFWTCDLRRLQRTSEIPQLAAKDMKEIENLDPDSVPDTTDHSNRVKGASKYSQLGTPACKELWDSVLRGSTHDEVGPAVLLLDLHVGVGDMLQAFCSLRSSRPNTFYLGFCEDANETMYVEQLMKENLADMYAQGHPLPTGEKLAENVPSDLLESLPGVPRMNVLAPRCDI